MRIKVVLVLIVSLLTSVHFGYSQQIGSIIFDNLPADMQLYARDENRIAQVPISGTVTNSNYSHISVVKFRNNERVGYQKQGLSANSSSNAIFNITATIKAELAEYAFEVYLVKSPSDSSRVVRRENIVGGDFYIIYGQSNAVSWEVDYQVRYEYCRSFGSLPGSGAPWGKSNDIIPRVGIFGVEFQRKIAEDMQIPTCVINGARAGASIQQLVARNPNNHADGNTFYGQLLMEAQRSGLLNRIRGIFYWQGETEANSDNPMSWAPDFERMLSQWKEDFPKVEKIYLFQLPLFGGGVYYDEIGVLREYMRTIDVKFPIIQPYAALGAPGWTFHYGLPGSLKLGQELAEMAKFHHYGAKEKKTSPSLQKAYYSTKERDEITLVFEDYQEMVYPKDSTYENISGSTEPVSTYSVKDFFYLNKQWQKLKSGRAEANRVIVKLKEVGSDSLIKYLPSKYHYAGLTSAPWFYLGPFLSNTLGFRAFAFHHNKIYNFEDLGNIQLTAAKRVDHVNLKWNKLSAVKGYVLDRISGVVPTQTHDIFYLSASQTEYQDLTARWDLEYTYRIRGIGDHAESNIAVSQVEADKIILGLEDEEGRISVFPNPVTSRLSVKSGRGGINKLQILDQRGIVILADSYNDNPEVEVDLKNLASGVYFVRAFLGETEIVKKIVVLR